MNTSIPSAKGTVELATRKSSHEGNNLLIAFAAPAHSLLLSRFLVNQASTLYICLQPHNYSELFPCLEDLEKVGGNNNW